MPRKVFVLLAVGLCNGGCDSSRRPPGPCTYSETGGMAVIVSVSLAPAHAYNCPRGSAHVVFDFRPDDPNALLHYHIPSWPDTGLSFTLDARINPPAEWVAKRGIAAGREYRAVRRDETAGTCAPVVHDIVGIDKLAERLLVSELRGDRATAAKRG